MSKTWYPKATQRDGPASKQGYGSHPQRALGEIGGIVGHSMEGSLSAALGELDKLDRRASWAFSNPKVGPMLQHYPLESVVWTNGSLESNVKFIGIEHEGVAGELINENQRQNLAGLLAWLLTVLPNVHAWTRNVTVWEHREMTAFGSDPTACPSNRIPWAQVLGLIEEDDMDADEKKAFRRYFIDPHGEAAYDAAYPGRQNWTRADVIFEGVAYLDAQHIARLFDEHKAIKDALAAQAPQSGGIDVSKIRLSMEGD